MVLARDERAGALAASALASGARPLHVGDVERVLVAQLLLGEALGGDGLRAPPGAPSLAARGAVAARPDARLGSPGGLAAPLGVSDPA